MKNIKGKKIAIAIVAIVLVVLVAIGVSVKASGNTSGIAKSKTFTENMDGYYVYFRAVDEAGNAGDWSNAQRIWIDTTTPTVTAKENSVTIKEGDVNELADYFTVVSNGTNADVDVVCTIGGTTYTTTETLTVEGSPYTVICTATKSGGKSGNASMELVVESAVPPVTIVANESSVLATKGIATTFESMFTITTATGDTTGVSKTYAIDGVTTSAIDTSALAVDTYTLTCNATLDGVTASASVNISVEPDFSETYAANTAGSIGVYDIPQEATGIYLLVTVVSTGISYEYEGQNETSSTGIWHNNSYSWPAGNVYYDVLIKFKKADGTFFLTTVLCEGIYNAPQCFVAGTKVYTTQGLVNIEDIKVGDIVYSMNMETMQVEPQLVSRTSKTIAFKDTCLISVGGEYIESTIGHDYYEKNKGWTDAYKLEKGDILIDGDGNERIVQDVQVIEQKEPITVYNFTVENNHNYFVGEDRILVHNTAAPTPTAVPPPPPCCFTKGTKVSTPKGFKNIEDINVGDIVYSMNLETMEVEAKKVEMVRPIQNWWKQTYLISTGGEYIESTPDHKYYVKDKGWVDACDLEIGNILTDEQGTEKVISDIQTKEYEETEIVYNFEVEDNRNYFVGEDKILVYTIPDNVE